MSMVVASAEPRLGELAKVIRMEHAAFERAAGSAVQSLIAVGVALRQARDMVNQGEWKTWVEKNCQFSLRTAQEYIRLTMAYSNLDAEAQRAAPLSIRQLTKQLALPPTQPPKLKTRTAASVARSRPATSAAPAKPFEAAKPPDIEDVANALYSDLIAETFQAASNFTRQQGGDVEATKRKLLAMVAKRLTAKR